MKKKILILDAFTTKHVGNLALLDSTLRLITNRLPDVNVEISAFDPESISATYPSYLVHECLWAQPLSRLNRRDRLIWIVREIVWILVHLSSLLIGRLRGKEINPTLYTSDERKIRFLHAVKSADVAVSISGEMISPVFRKRLPFFLIQYLISILSGTSVVLFPQSIGKFHRGILALFTRSILNRCAYVMPRDELSLQNVQHLKIKPSVVKLVPDIAITQEYAHKSITDSVLACAGMVHERRPYVGVTISEFNRIDYLAYRKTLAEMCRYVCRSLNGSVILFSPNMPYRGERSDYETAIELKEEIGAEYNVTLLNETFTPAIFKGLLSRMDFFISSRMHASILATMAGTPTIVINSQPKLKGYMNMIGQEEWALTVETAADSSMLIAKLQRLIEQSSETRRELDFYRLIRSQEACKAGDHLFEVLSNT